MMPGNVSLPDSLTSDRCRISKLKEFPSAIDINFLIDINHVRSGYAGKNNSDQTYSCPREGFPGIMGSNWGPPWNSPYITALSYEEEMEI